jgi:hypothetical protein
MGMLGKKVVVQVAIYKKPGHLLQAFHEEAKSDTAMYLSRAGNGRKARRENNKRNKRKEQILRESLTSLACLIINILHLVKNILSFAKLVKCVCNGVELSLFSYMTSCWGPGQRRDQERVCYSR